jgi:predicted DNA-binding transcriptional regulator AlpA
LGANAKKAVAEIPIQGRDKSERLDTAERATPSSGSGVAPVSSTHLDTRETVARKTPEIELWDRQTVLEFFGGTKPMHFSTLYRGISVGFYPKPIHTSGNTVRWLAHECRAALDRMIAERGEPKPSPPPARRGRPRGRKAAAEREAASKTPTAETTT